MSSTAKVWRKVVHTMHWSLGIEKPLYIGIKLDQSPQLLPRLLHSDHLLVSTGGRPIYLLNVFL